MSVRTTTRRLRCQCHHAWRLSADLLEGVLHDVCGRCGRVLVVARRGSAVCQLSVTADEAAGLTTVALVRAFVAARGPSGGSAGLRAPPCPTHDASAHAE